MDQSRFLISTLQIPFHKTVFNKLPKSTLILVIVIHIKTLQSEFGFPSTFQINGTRKFETQIEDGNWKGAMKTHEIVWRMSQERKENVFFEWQPGSWNWAWHGEAAENLIRVYRQQSNVAKFADFQEENWISNWKEIANPKEIVFLMLTVRVWKRKWSLSNSLRNKIETGQWSYEKFVLNSPMNKTSCKAASLISKRQIEFQIERR